jgi:putative thioredoxin
MSTNAYIFELSQNNFQTLAIDNSHHLPVVVEFMSINGEPCIALEHQIQTFTEEFPGQFIFGKVDIYEQPELAKQFDIQRLPTVKVFVNGEVQRSEVGQMDANELAEMLKSVGIYRASDELRLQARDKHLQGDTTGAIQLLTQAIQSDPSNTRVALDMIQILLDIDQIDTAVLLFNKLPDRAKESDTGRLLIGQLTFKQLAAKTAGLSALQAQVAQTPDNAEAGFDLALCLVANHQYDEAMAHLFAVQAQQPDFKNGAAKEMIVTLINMLAPNDPARAQRYRQQLSNLLN